MDALTKQLADALLYQLRYHPEHTVGMCSDALEAFDAAKDAPDARDLEIAALRTQLAAIQRRTSRHSLAKDLGSAVDGDAAIMARMTAEIAALLKEVDDSNARHEITYAALKATQPDLQPLHDLVKNWADMYDEYDDYYACSELLKEAIAKLQSAGAVKPAVEVTDEMAYVAMAAYDRRTGNGSGSDYPGMKAALVAGLKAVKP